MKDNEKIWEDVNEIQPEGGEDMEPKEQTTIEEPDVIDVEPEKPEPPPIVTRKKKRHPVRTFVGFLLFCGVLAGAAWLARDFWPDAVSFYFSRRAPGAGPYMITSAKYIGTDLSEDGANFTAEFEIDIMEKRGWKKIPLVPSHVAIIAAELPKGSYLYLADGMYCMFTKKNGELKATVNFSVAAKEAEGKYTVKFTRVPALTCVLDATFPQEDIDVAVTGAQSTDHAQTNKTTHVVAALPDETPIEVTWEKALPEIKEGPPKFHAETKTLISITDGLIIGKSKIDFSILHTPTRELKLDVPEGVSVIEITGTQIRDWRVTDGLLAIQLEKEVIGPYALSIKFEASPDMASGKITMPVITGADVEREKGTIGVVALSNLEIKNNKMLNANLIDVKELPSEIVGMTGQPVLLAYRYVDPEFEIGLEISKHKDIGVLLTMIDRAHCTVMQTFDGKRITRALYNVRNNRNQFLRLALPEGADLWSASVAGRSVQPARDDDGRILLPLVRSGGGGMSAFPVEIVYAEEGTKPNERGTGTAKVNLPSCSEPIMHLMVSLYVPDEGRYDEFSGTLRSVEKFTAVTSSRKINSVMNNRAVSQIQQVYAGKSAKATPGTGTIKVQLPISGKLYLLEKILVVKDQQWFSYGFSRLRG